MASKPKLSRQMLSNYEFLERERLRKMHLNESYSSFYLGGSRGPYNEPRQKDNSTEKSVPGVTTPRGGNSMSPFSTTGKPTCGYAFSRETDNRRHLLDVIPTDLSKGRPAVEKQTSSEPKQATEPTKMSVTV